MNRPLTHTLFLIFFSTLLLPGCASRKKLVYFQQNSGDTTQITANRNFTPVFKTDDFLEIIVTGSDPEAVKPFNMPDIVGNVPQAGYTTGAPARNGYLIDARGTIDFPVIGKISLAGLNRMEATALIREKLDPYVGGPIVSIRILNFKVTVLGDVARPGTFQIPNERITLLEAIGLAGDLNISGVRKNVLVIRDTDGVKTETRVDLTSKDVFSSPVYYLHQNDVIYVQPNKAKINSSVVSASAGIILSVTSLIVTTIVLITK